MPRITQAACRLAFAAAMLALTKEIEAIDAKTPHSNIEPDWWLRMMEMHRQALNYARQYGVKE